MFDDLALRPLSPTRSVEPVGFDNAVQRFALATADIMPMRKDGYSELPISG